MGLCYVFSYEEQSLFSSASFLSRIVTHFTRKGISVECVQTNHGFEFTGRFSGSRLDLQTLFESRGQRTGGFAISASALSVPFIGLLLVRTFLPSLPICLTNLHGSRFFADSGRQAHPGFYGFRGCSPVFSGAAASRNAHRLNAVTDSSL